MKKLSLIVVIVICLIGIKSSFAENCIPTTNIITREYKSLGSKIIDVAIKGKIVNIENEDDGWIKINNGWAKKIWFVCKFDKLRLKSDLITAEKENNTKLISEIKEKLFYIKRIHLSNQPPKKIKNLGDWKVHKFVDNFGDPTNDKYIEFKTTGVFNNSAIRNAICYVDFIVGYDSSVGLLISEYNKYRPWIYFIGDDGRLKLKNSKGQTSISYSINKRSTKGGLSIRSDNILRFMRNSIGDVKFYLTDGHSTTYHFVINANGITAALNEIGLY